MEDWRHRLHPSGWKVLHALRPADERVARRAAGSSTTTRSACRSSNASTRSVRASSPRTRVSAGRSPISRSRPRRRRDIGPAAAAFPASSSSSTTPDTSAIPTVQEGPVRRGRRDPRRRPADQERRGRGDRARAATCTPSSAARGSSCCAGRSRPRTCSASCSSRSGPIASCGAPTRRGTARRSRSSTRSAPSGSRSGCRTSSATRRSRPTVKERILSANAQALYGVSDDDAARRRPRARPGVGLQRVGRAHARHRDRGRSPPNAPGVRTRHVCWTRRVLDAATSSVACRHGRRQSGRTHGRQSETSRALLRRRRPLGSGAGRPDHVAPAPPERGRDRQRGIGRDGATIASIRGTRCATNIGPVEPSTPPRRSSRGRARRRQADVRDARVHDGRSRSCPRRTSTASPFSATLARPSTPTGVEPATVTRSHRRYASP